MASKKKQAGRHRKQAARHRKVVARNRKRAARNGIFAAAVGLSLAVGVGQGVAAASTDGGSSDSGSAPQSSNNSGSNSRHSATPNRTNASAGPARTRSTGKQPAANSNSGSSVSVRSSGSARPVVADADATDATTQPTTSTTTPSSTGSTSTPAPSTTDGTVTPETSATGGTSTPPPADSTTTTTTAVVTPNPTTAKSTSARAAVAPSAAAYSMNGDLTAVQDGAGPITTPAHYDIQTTLDAWAAQLDALMAAPLTSVNGWLKFPVTFLNAFFKPSIVVDRLSYGLNGLATLMDEFVPPFKMVDGAPSTITQASVTAAVLAGAIVLFNTSQTVDIQHWIDEAVSLAGALQDIAANPVVNGLTANDMDGVIGAARAAFLSPKTVLDMTIDIGPAPNPVSLAMYVVVVAIFRRFADVATDHQPVVTDMQQTSQHLPNGSGTTVSGYVQFYDADGDPITSYGFTEPNDSRFTVTVVDGTNGRMNWTVWDWNPLSSDTSPKTLTFTMTVLAQGDGQISVSKPYMPNGNETQKTVTVTVYYNQAVGSMTNTVGSTSPMGVVRGTVSAPQNPDNPMTYSLNGASGGSAYTANGGIVKLNPSTGAYVYTPNRASGATSDSFQLTSTDSFGHTYTTTVSVPVSATSPVTTNASVPGKVTGNLNINGADTGLMTYSIGTAPNALRGTVVLNADGTFTYTRTAAGHTQPTQDSFTILGTDSTGKTTTVAVVNVNPTVSNSAPVGNGVTVGSSVLQDTDASFNRQQTTTGTLKATDADGDSLTFTAGTYSTSNGGSITVNADGTFTYKSPKKLKLTEDRYWHNAALTGAAGDTFTISVADGFGGTTNVTYSVPIEKLNSAPSSSVSVGIDSNDGLGVVRGTITGSDPDNSNINYYTYGVSDTLSYSMIGATGGSVYSANGGIVKVNSDGTLTYTPKVGVTSDSFQVLVDDGHGGTTTATVSLSGLTTPSPTTNVSTAIPGKVTGQLNVPAGESGLFTYSLGTGPSKGAVTVNADGSYSYTRTGTLGHSTTPADSFTIVATEVGTGKTVTVATITVTPTISNSAPTGNGVTVGSSSLNDTDASINRQQATTGTLKATDTDGDSLTFTAGTYGTTNGGSITVNADGTFTYKSQKMLKGTQDLYWHNAAVPGAPGDTFTIVVSDGFGGSTNVTYSIPVATLNSAPSTTTSVSGSADGLGVVSGTITGSDSDSFYNYITLSVTPVKDSLTYSLYSAPTNGGIVTVNSDGSFTYVPTKGVTSDSFQVLVDDGHGGRTPSTVTLGSLTTPGTATNIDTSVTGVVQGKLNIPAGDTSLGLTYGGSGTTSKGSVVVNSDGTFTYTRNPALGRVLGTDATDSFNITATRDGRTVTIATVSVTPLLGYAPQVTVNGVSATGTTATATLSTPGSLTTSGANRTQTINGAAGSITWSDADGDAMKINGVAVPTGSGYVTVNTTNAGTVQLYADGHFVYTKTGSYKDYFHNAAKTSSTGNAVNDSFDITVTDNYGGTSTMHVVVPIYAINSTPTISGGYTIFGDVNGIKFDDADGDSLSWTPSGFNGGNGLATSTVSGSHSTTVKDGYYLVNNATGMFVDAQGNPLAAGAPKVAASAYKAW